MSGLFKVRVLLLLNCCTDTWPRSFTPWQLTDLNISALSRKGSFTRGWRRTSHGATPLIYQLLLVSLSLTQIHSLCLPLERKNSHRPLPLLMSNPKVLNVMRLLMPWLLISYYLFYVERSSRTVFLNAFRKYFSFKSWNKDFCHFCRVSL